MLRQEEAAIVGNIYYSSFVREPEVHCVDIRSLSEDKGATASREKGFIQRGLSKNSEVESFVGHVKGDPSRGEARIFDCCCVRSRHASSMCIKFLIMDCI